MLVWLLDFFFPSIQASDEEAFQHARKMIIAQLQSITYNEYLPAILGPDNGIRNYTGYKEDVDAGISTEFSTVAFRLVWKQFHISSMLLLYSGRSPVSVYSRDICQVQYQE